MANAHSFPLLRLPCLAREHIVKVMDVREQYLFSKISKKSERIAKNGVRRLQYVFHLQMFSSETYIHVRKDGSPEYLQIHILDVEEDEFITFAVENYQEQSIASLIFLKGLFKISSFVLKCKKIPTDFFKQVIATVKNLNIKIDELTVKDCGQGFYKWVMENCRDVRRLNNGCLMDLLVDFEWNTQQPFTFDYCSLSHAFGLTLDQLTRLFWDCRCFEIWVYDYTMTEQDFNQLIKMWKKGDTKLEFVQIPVDDEEPLDFQEVMKDIRNVPVKKAYLQNILTYINRGSAFKIQQNNGKEAVVCLSSEHFIITTHFKKKDCDFWTEHGDSDEYDSEDDENDNEEELL